MEKLRREHPALHRKLLDVGIESLTPEELLKLQREGYVGLPSRIANSIETACNEKLLREERADGELRSRKVDLEEL